MNLQLVEALQSATPRAAVRVFGVTPVGVNATTGLKLLFTLALVLVGWRSPCSRSSSRSPATS
ncbi:MAG: hypothetical protein M3Y73_08855 [Actinomycetota bacterium]|nr:hypothetical protein [Actinomycetota bacterium]